jgi:hypothetical protein
MKTGRGELTSLGQEKDRFPDDPPESCRINRRYEIRKKLYTSGMRILLKWLLGLDGMTNSVTGKWTATAGRIPRYWFQLLNKSGKLERIEIGDGSG